MRLFFFDTETTGIVKKGLTLDQQPHIVELGAIAYDVNPGMEPVEAERLHFFFRPPIPIPEEASKIHGITDERVKNMPAFQQAFPIIVTHLVLADCIIAHNASFDMNMLYFEAKRMGQEKDILLQRDKIFCTMEATTDLCRIRGKFGKYKWPRLQELHSYLFGREFDNAHSAEADIEATATCFMELMRKELVPPPKCLVDTLRRNNRPNERQPQRLQTPQGPVH